MHVVYIPGAICASLCPSGHSSSWETSGSLIRFPRLSVTFWLKTADKLVKPMCLSVSLFIKQYELASAGVWLVGSEKEKSELGLCPWDCSARYCTNRRGRPSLLHLLSGFGLISDWWLVSISPLEIEQMHFSAEGLRPWDWSYPVLQYLREWPTPTVFVTGAVVGHQPPRVAGIKTLCALMQHQSASTRS